jgi:hypothetical protein
MVCLSLLLLSYQGFADVANAAQPSVSGHFVSSFSDQPFGQSLGNGTYTLFYSYPAVVSLGSNFTTQISLQVNELNVLQQYVEQYQVTVRVNAINGQAASGMVGDASPLFPGAIWGPKNVTIPLTQKAMGAFTGPLNASVIISLATTVRVGPPANQDHTHEASQLVGNLTIESSANGNGGAAGSLASGAGFFPYVVVVAGVVLVSVGIFLPKLYPEKRSESK